MNIQYWLPLGSLYSLLQFIPQHKQDFFHSKIILNSIWKGSGPKRTKTIMPKKEREWTCGRKYSVSAAAAKSLQLCPTLCDPIDGSPPGSPVPGILQARTLEWVAISSSNAWKWKVKVKSCPNLSNPMDCSLPGSSAHGIFQARVLEWVAIAFSDMHHTLF